MTVFGAVILAAGASRRMGQPKLVLPWGNTSVLGQVVSTLANAGATELVAVTGAAREMVEAEIERLALDFPLRGIYNPKHETGEMLSSLQTGLTALSPQVAASFVALGDQPQLSLQAARGILSAFERSGSRLIIPSWKMRRGHPWLVQRSLWPAILALPLAQTLRDFLLAHENEIEYVPADESIRKDLDTPEEYQQAVQQKWGDV